MRAVGEGTSVMSAQVHAQAAHEPVRIMTIDTLDLRLEPHPWAFSAERSADIDAHFQRRRAATPALWNGWVLLLHSHRIDEDGDRRRLSGSFIETNYAAFLAWQDWGCPPAGVVNGFALGALRSADGALLMGVMGPQTANVGQIYFPGGTPDPSDVAADGRVDLAANVMRELAEETGLTTADVAPQRGWTLCAVGARLALIKELRSGLPAAALRDRIGRHLAADPTAELGGIYIARGPADIDPMMPRFMQAYLRDYWSAERMRGDGGTAKHGEITG